MHRGTAPCAPKIEAMPYLSELSSIDRAVKHDWLERYNARAESLESIACEVLGGMERGYLVYYGIVEAALEARLTLREGEIVAYPGSDEVMELARTLFAELLEADEGARQEVAERNKRIFADIIEVEFLNLEDKERALFARYGWPYARAQTPAPA